MAREYTHKKSAWQPGFMTCYCHVGAMRLYLRWFGYSAFKRARRSGELRYTRLIEVRRD